MAYDTITREQLVRYLESEWRPDDEVAIKRLGPTEYGAAFTIDAEYVDECHAETEEVED